MNLTITTTTTPAGIVTQTREWSDVELRHARDAVGMVADVAAQQWDDGIRAALIAIGWTPPAGQVNRSGAYERLCAAAPDLLAALIDVRDNVKDDCPDMWHRVFAAIEKATGGVG